MSRAGKIETTVRRMLDECGLRAAPVDVTRVAQHLGLTVHEAAFDADISGFLYQDGSQAVVGINQAHSTVRKRFTLAHECGHFVLHQKNTTYVDRNSGPTVLLRDRTSGQGSDRKEVEANSFAAELLMPTHFIEQDIDRLNDVQDADEMIIKLARRYEVSAQAMTIRLMKLGYIHDSF